MFVCNAKSLKFLAVNAAAVHHYGYVGQQFSKMSIYDLRPREDWEGLRQRALSGDVTRQNGEVRRHVKADGTEIDVATYSTAMRFKGEPAVIFAAVDVTERLRAEARLREQKWLTDIAVSNLTQGLVLFDSNERLVLANQRYMELYGLSSDLVKVGATNSEIMQHKKDLGIWVGDIELLRQSRLSRLAEGKPWRWIVELPDSRVVQIILRPLANGGWISTHEDITERQRAEVKIREQKQQLDAAVGNMAQGLVMFDADQCLVQWNRRYIEMYGLSPDIVKVGCSDLDLMKHRKELGVISGDLNQRRQDLAARLAKGETWSSVIDLPDGRSIQRIHRPMAGGGWVSTHEDITERKRDQDRLKKSEQHFQDAQIVGGMGSWEWDIVSNTLDWSDHIFRIFGTEPQSFGATYEAFLDFIKPDDRDRVTAAVNAALKESKPYDIEHRIVRPDGQERWVRERGSVEFDDAGEPVNMLGTVQDITDRKEAERRVQEREERLSAIMDNAADGIITITVHGIVESFNRAAEAIFGYSEEEIRGQSINVLMPEPDRSQHDGYIASYLTTGKAKVIGVGPREITALRKDGSTLPMSLAISVMEVGGKKIFIGIARDITERHRADNKLREKRLQLDAAVDNMTQGLAMFDAEGRVVLVNQSYIEMYGMSPDVVKEGCTYRELLDHANDLKLVPDDAEAHRLELLARVAEGKPWNSVLRLPDGRRIQRVRRPMPDGGWLSTREEIT
jgi:PAS domain S-box-containing protein